MIGETSRTHGRTLSGAAAEDRLFSDDGFRAKDARRKPIHAIFRFDLVRVDFAKPDKGVETLFRTVTVLWSLLSPVTAPRP